jgi:hypothetical protein
MTQFMTKLGRATRASARRSRQAAGPIAGSRFGRSQSGEPDNIGVVP